MRDLGKSLWIPWMPVLFAVSFVLSMFSSAESELYLRSLFVPLTGVILLSVVVYGAARLLVTGKERAEIFASICLVLLFVFGGVLARDWPTVLVVKGWQVSKLEVLYGTWGVLFVVSLIILRRIKGDLATASKFLTVVAVIAVVVPLFEVSVYEVRRRLLPPIKSPMVLPKVDVASVSKDSLPDIYFILPEDFSSPSVYKKYFKYDESGFVKTLKDDGFYVAEGATSNYPKSFESITAILNMEYLDYLSAYKNSSDMTLVNPLIDNNNVMKFLKKFGYKYYQLGSWWDPTKFNLLADENFTLESESKLNIPSFAYDLAESTMLGPVMDKYLSQGVVGDSDNDDRARILYQFSKLAQVVTLPGPKFVFAHIIAPHGPYVFDKNCNFIGEETASRLPEVEDYVNQTVCVDLKLEQVVKMIIGGSKRPPVIVMVTDEGAPFLGHETPNSWDNWKWASDALIAEKFPIFSAYYLPGVSTASLYPTMTPVNVFRQVFNLYFNAGFNLLPDRDFIFQDLNNVYQFTEVTGKLRQ